MLQDATKMTYPITLRRDTNDTYLVAFPDLPWVHTYGETKDEARARLPMRS